MNPKIVIIGGGAAGIFAALRLAALLPEAKVVVYEKSNKLLAKVRVSGGGRCNVSHECHQLSALVKHYPRGEKPLRKILTQFMPQDMKNWLQARGVALKTEADGRIFPQSDSSQTIIDCFLQEAQKHKVRLRKEAEVQKITPQDKSKWLLHFRKDYPPETADCVLIATGGSPKLRGLEWLAELGLELVPPVPSLFTFNMPQEDNLKQLAGLSVEKARLKILKTKLVSEGALLITHWGMSGPAVLKLSAWGARTLAEKAYDFGLQINWLPDYSADELGQKIAENQQQKTNRKLANESLGLPKRLWQYLLEKSALRAELTWGEIGQKTTNRLIEVLQNDQYAVKGKTTFKEEFVTCGGVALSGVNPQTMESRLCPNLFFAGEVLDIDGITGGFNFQAAWATAWVAAQGIANNLKP